MFATFAAASGGSALSRRSQMRAQIIAFLVVFLANCNVICAAPENRDVVAYYDRNGDGVVDYELHRVRNTVYLSYALIDSKYRGRYDEKMKLAYPFNSDRVDIPVPRHVKFIRGMPPYITDQRFNAPTPAL